MNYAKIRNYDIANGEGVRTSLFVSGCTNHCPGCFNPEEQDFNCGRPFTKETIAEIHKMLANPVISGLSLLGGDPLCQDYTSAITGYPIVVPTTINKRYVKDVARRAGVSIPEPIVMSEDTRGRRIGGVLIDNAEEIIRAYAAEHFNAPVIAYTITVDGDGDSA